MSDDTTPPFKVSSQTRVSAPITLLAGLVVTACVGYAAWTANIEKNVAQDRHMEHIDTRVNNIEVDQRTMREILIRIDANVENMRRENRRYGQ